MKTFDIGLISRALQNGPLQSAPDPSVQAILRLAQTGDHVRAAEQAAELLADGIPDIRLIVAFALGVFEEGGPAVLPGLLLAFADALVLRWDVLRPEVRRKPNVDSALALLFRTLNALIDFYDATRDSPQSQWKRWAADITDNSLPAQCQSAIAELHRAIGKHIDGARCLDGLAGVANRATQYFNKVPPALPVPAPASESESEAGIDLETQSEEKPSPEPPPTAARTAGTVETSPALDAFIRKLDAFAKLVERGSLTKAAIVALDIRGSVEHFDPRVYLPKLLTPHYRLLSAHAEKLAPYWESSPVVESLTQLYQVDLDEFLKQ